MVLRQYKSVRFERVIDEGRTHPLVLGCRPVGHDGPTRSMVVKALGCPEVASTRSLVCEVVGNAMARRMGIGTPEPCIIQIDAAMAEVVNAGVRSLGHRFEIHPGSAAGCELLALAPYTVGQGLSPDQRTQATRLYVFDMLSQNTDRRPEKVNCGLTKSGLVAFDFETCFQHIFLPIVGGLGGEHWEPSKCIQSKGHLFHGAAKQNAPSEDSVALSLTCLTPVWWKEFWESLPEAWRPEASQIGAVIRQIAEHADEFAKDIRRSLM